jgi:hypothetical protein
LVTLNNRQLLAIQQLALKVNIEELVLTQAPDAVVVLVMRDINDNERKLALDQWGQGRLVP